MFHAKEESDESGSDESSSKSDAGIGRSGATCPEHNRSKEENPRNRETRYINGDRNANRNRNGT